MQANLQQSDLKRDRLARMCRFDEFHSLTMCVTSRLFANLICKSHQPRATQHTAWLLAQPTVVALCKGGSCVRVMPRVGMVHDCQPAVAWARLALSLC